MNANAIEKLTHERNLRGPITVHPDHPRLREYAREGKVWGAYYRRPEWEPSRWIVTGWYTSERNAARYARPIDGGVLRVLPTADDIATEGARVFGADVEVQLDRTTDRARMVVDGWPETVTYHAATLYDVLREAADDAGATPEGDARVCATLERAGALVARRR